METVMLHFMALIADSKIHRRNGAETVSCKWNLMLVYQVQNIEEDASTVSASRTYFC
jgi:hypothetical protein